MSHLLLLVGVLMLAAAVMVQADLMSDRQALVDFASRVAHSRILNWKDNNSVCTSWVGVSCNVDHSRVTALRLPGVGFLGAIPPSTLGKLDALRVLSLRANSLCGKVPSDITSIPSLQFLFLQHNNFSGTIPESLSPTLLALDLSSNSFSGPIPPTLQNFTRLMLLNLSHNNLTGPIPDSLHSFSTSSFVGNSLCGAPLDYNCTTPIKKPSLVAVVGIVVGCCTVLLAMVVALVWCLKKRSRASEGKEKKTEKEAADDKKKKKIQMSSEAFGSGIQDAEKNKLVFFQGCAYNFDLEDLLRASAEVLGKGSYGTAYKAILDEGTTTVVVKRLKDVGIAKREFEQNMEIISKVAHHPNLVPLRAYYYSKDEKLMVYDYVAAGSLAFLLHGYRGNAQVVNWSTRMKMLIEIGRGIQHIHSEKMIHGNIKSSNVLLTGELESLVSDFGLTLTMNFQAAINSRSVGYQAPEVMETRKVSQKSDVYSFGVLLLEMLTGKAPLKSEGGVVDLPRWVQSVVREEWTSEVFDTELLRTPNAEEEMVHVLQIALACVARLEDMRPTMEQVVKMMEDLGAEDNRPSDEDRSNLDYTP